MEECLKRESSALSALEVLELLNATSETDLEALYARWIEEANRFKDLPLQAQKEYASCVNSAKESIEAMYHHKKSEFELRKAPLDERFYNVVKSGYDTLYDLISKDLNSTQTDQELESFRVRWLGRNKGLAELMHTLKDRSLEEKRVIGPLLNDLKKRVSEAFVQKEQEIEQRKIKEKALRSSYFDVTAYKIPEFEGSLHPYTNITERIEDIFLSMGFEIVEGPEVETDYYNFEALNIPKDHPARDMQDTFWLTLPGLLMRTHTSSVEIHVMSNRKPPIAIAVPGRAYRNEATDASHDFMFMQLEGLFVDKGVSLAHLFATMKSFLQTFFEKKDIAIKIRPSYFPFVEPGVEIDMSCPFCTTGCSVCKRTRWIEICGAGLCHPAVLEASGINSKEYSGFAFGFGMTRLVMLKYGITDLRLLHANKIDFLKQF